MYVNVCIDTSCVYIYTYLSPHIYIYIYMHMSLCISLGKFSAKARSPCWAAASSELRMSRFSSLADAWQRGSQNQKNPDYLRGPKTT